MLARVSKEKGRNICFDRNFKKGEKGKEKCWMIAVNSHECWFIDDMLIT